MGNSSIRNELLKKGGNLIEAEPHIQKLTEVMLFTSYCNVSLPMSYHSNLNQSLHF